jgi:hypothetical protein
MAEYDGAVDESEQLCIDAISRQHTFPQGVVAKYTNYGKLLMASILISKNDIAAAAEQLKQLDFSALTENNLSLPDNFMWSVWCRAIAELSTTNNLEKAEQCVQIAAKSFNFASRQNQLLFLDSKLTYLLAGSKKDEALFCADKAYKLSEEWVHDPGLDMGWRAVARRDKQKRRLSQVRKLQLDTTVKQGSD